MVATINVCGLEIPRPLQRHLVVSLVTLSIFFTAFLLFILVGLSLTITPSIYLIEVSASDSTTPVSNVATTFYFGVWGVCATNSFDTTIGQGECFGPQLGYTIPTAWLADVGLSASLGNVAETSLLVLLSLHLVVAGLSTIIFVLSFFLHSHPVAIIALTVAVVVAIVGSVVFAADVALVVEVRAHIDSLFADAQFNVRIGNAVWMILVGLILTWVAVVVLSARACYCCGVRRPKVSGPDAEEKTHL